MHIEEYLKLHQPVIYTTFLNALKNNKLSHAYLISGDIGTPLLKIAKFLAKSILCDDPSPLACDSCITCLRIDDGYYPDLYIFDGSEKAITDANVSTIQTALETYAVEKKGIRVYILNICENMTPKAINSLLKTLEEPTTETYAFLTTTNENRILPTIISRCQVMKLKPINRNTVINEAVDLSIPRDDAELLSYFYNDSDLIFELTKDENKYGDFKAMKELYNLSLEALKELDKNGILYFFLSKVNAQIKTRPQLSFFLDMLIQTFEEMFNIVKEHEIYLSNYATILKEIFVRFSNVEQTLEELMRQKSLVGVSIPQIIDHIAITITKGMYE